MNSYNLIKLGVPYPRNKLNSTQLQQLIKKITIKILKKIPGKRNQIINIKNYKIDKNYIYLPRFYAINGKLNLNNKLNGELINEDYLLNKLIKIDYNFAGMMLDYQKIIVDYLMGNIYDNNSIIKGSSCCTLKLETGYGKTYIAMNLIDKLKLRTLIIVPNTIILEQWEDALKKLFPYEKIGRYYGKEKRIENITLGIINSCCMKTFKTKRLNEVKELNNTSELKKSDKLNESEKINLNINLTINQFYSHFDFIIFDEIHKYTGAKQRIIFDNSQSLCMLGLSASIDRKKVPLLTYITSRIGKVIEADKIPNLELDKIKFNSIVKIVNFRGNPKYTKPILNDDGILQYMSSAKRVASEPQRNIAIYKQLLSVLDHNIFILTIFREHVLSLYELINEYLPKYKLDELNMEVEAPELNDDELNELNKLQNNKLQNLNNNSISSDDIVNIMGGSTSKDIENAKKRKIIISTYKYTGTGVSIDNMTALIIAAPIKNEILQVAGRIFRKNEKYDDIKRVIIDICDVRSPLKNQVYTRIEEYKRRNCEIEKMNYN